jgi:hypothetical protein
MQFVRDVQAVKCRARVVPVWSRSPKAPATPMTAMTTYWNVRLPASAIVNVA